MKKLIAFILAAVYLFAAVPAACNASSCEGDCDGLRHVKTEDHHSVYTGVYKLDPLSPATVAGDRSASQGCAPEILRYSFHYVPVRAGDIPLFVRHCNFRI